MWRKQSGEMKEQVTDLSSQVQQLTQLMFENRKEYKKEGKEKELRYQSDRRKSEMEFDAKLRKSEERIEDRREEFKQLLIGCMSQLQKGHGASAEPLKKAGRADGEKHKTV